MYYRDSEDKYFKNVLIITDYGRELVNSSQSMTYDFVLVEVLLWILFVAI